MGEEKISIPPAHVWKQYMTIFVLKNIPRKIKIHHLILYHFKLVILEMRVPTDFRYRYYVAQNVVCVMIQTCFKSSPATFKKFFFFQLPTHLACVYNYGFIIICWTRFIFPWNCRRIKTNMNYINGLRIFFFVSVFNNLVLTVSNSIDVKQKLSLCFINS